jgi:hypothetical protein
MKKLINLAFALLISASAFAQGYNVEVCVNITGPQPNGPIVASLTYYANGLTNTVSQTLNNIILPYTLCFPAYVQTPDSGVFAFATGTISLSSCSPIITYNYWQLIDTNATISVNVQNCNSGPICSAMITQNLGSTTISATSTGLPPFTYSWDGGITFSSISYYTMNGPGNYCVIVQDGAGCTATDCFIYAPTPNCSAIIDISGNGPYTLEAIGTGIPPFTYQWSNGSTNAIIIADSTNTYCLTITDSVGCVDTTCVFLTVGASCYTYILENTINGTSTLTAIPDSSFSGITSYSWSLNGSPIAGLSSAQITPNAPGQYCVTVIYNNNCVATNCYLFNPGNPVGGCSVVVAAVVDSTSNNTYTFYTFPTGTPAFSYSWIFSNGTTSTQINPTVTFNNNAGFNWANVTVTDSTGCTSSYSISLPFNPPNGNCYSSFGMYSNYQFGNPGEVFFQSNIQNSGTASVTYSWDFGDSTFSTLQNPTHIFLNSGYYNICLTTVSNGCTYTSCNNVYIDLAWWNNNPFQGNCTAGFMILTNPINNAGLINIINTSQGNNLFYTWSFGNGFISNNPLPFTTINNPGVYEICVNILDTINNCSDTFCDTITIDSLGNVFRSAMSGNVGLFVSGTPQPNALLSVIDSKKEMDVITIVPNPNNGRFSINTDWIQGQSTLELIDVTGKLVLSQTINTTKGQKAVSIDLQNVADGSYLVRVVSDQRVQTVKLLINH